MYYEVEFDINSFEFWGGAVSTIESVKKLDKMDELEDLIIEAFGDSESVSQTDINDFVWFESDKILGWNNFLSILKWKKLIKQFEFKGWRII